MKKIILILSMFILSSSVFAINRGEIRNQVRNLTSDNSGDTTRQRWSDTELNFRIAQSHLDIVRKSRCLQSTTYYNITANVSTYSLTTDLLLIERVGYWVKGTTNVYKKIDRWTLFGLDNDNLYWQNMGAGLPLKYYVYSNNIGLIPKPDSNNSGNNKLMIQYTIKPSTFIVDTDVPFNDFAYLYPYHELLIWYTVAQCSYDEGDNTRGDYYLQRYYYLLQLMIQELQNKVDWYPSFKLQ